MIERIISGGQTGVDQAALRAARRFGIPTGGTAAILWETEDGPAPWLSEFGLVECKIHGYPARTKANVLAADATLLLVCGIIGYGSRGSQLVLKLVGERSHAVQDLCRSPDKAIIADWIVKANVRILNVAGNRESGAPGIGAKAEDFLADLFRLLGFVEV